LFNKGASSYFMKLTIPYLNRTFPLDIPDGNLLRVAEPNKAESYGTEDEILVRALDAARLTRPAGPIGFRQFLEGARDVLVIINDATRPTPTAAMLKALLPFFEEAGLEPGGLSLLVAAGAHRAPSEDEYRAVLGEHYALLRPRCSAHDSRKDDEMVSLGVTKRGTPVILNRRVVEADRVVVTGSVEPHYFAGFTGGPKAFLPGVAAYESIEANHAHALENEARALELAGNPVHLDMDEAAEFISTPVFSLMTVLDRDQKTAAAFSGDLMESFAGAVELSKKIFCVEIPEKADIVISVAKHPMDIDVYQSQKAIDNGALALNDNGTLILVSSCRGGLGEKNFAKLLMSAASPADVISKIRLEYKLGYHKSAKMAMVSDRAMVVAVTEIPASQLEAMFIGKAASPQAALDKALERAKARGTAQPKVLALPDGCVTVPVTEGGRGITRIPGATSAKLYS
jgi:nickel-dependent lactate racemase